MTAQARLVSRTYSICKLGAELRPEGEGEGVANWSVIVKHQAQANSGFTDELYTVK